MTQLEKDIERKLRLLVESKGGRCLKWVCPGWSGVPDRIILLPGGRVIFCELKRPKGGKVSKLQEKWREWLTKLGFHVATVYTVEDVERLGRVVQVSIRASRNCTDCFFEDTPEDEFPCEACAECRLWVSK